jgi:6-pyruvoyltetrahydropterin/6-carboxytetrahydropterin synthase
MKTLLTRRFAFSASHRLHSEALDAAQNARCYGLCENIHGHNYRLEVTVQGTVDPRTGFFCNVLELLDLVQKRVVDPCEHQYLNDVPLFRGLIVTMENLAARMWQEIEQPLAERGMELVELQLGEVAEHWVTLRK